MTQQTNERPIIGASACLKGKKVRFDGGHKANHFINNDLVNFFDIQTVCPEVDIGLGIPRPVIQLRRFNNEDEVRLVFSKNPDQELTTVMKDYAINKVDSLPQLDGFIFKKDSPSCGFDRVPVVNNKTGMRKRDGIGVFAEVFKQKYPNVPTEDEGRLNDLQLRENFLERVYAHYRWRLISDSDNPLQAFREFHKNYKLILMAKDNTAYRKLGRLSATLTKNNFEEVTTVYIKLFMEAMSRIPSQGHHINVMMHIMGYLKENLSKKDKVEILEWFETYRDKRIQRVTPLMLLQHHFKKHPNDYIADQYYLSPFPNQLMLPV